MDRNSDVISKLVPDQLGAYAVSTITPGVDLNSPRGITVDTSGNLYLCDRGNKIIRKLVPGSGDYTDSIIAGQLGISGNTDGDGLTTALFDGPEGITIDASGNLYVGDIDRIRKLVPGPGGYTVSTIISIPGYDINVIARDISGNLYVWGSTSIDYIIYKIINSDSVYTLFTIATSNIENPTFNASRGIAVDSSGNLYYTDYNFNIIRKFAPGLDGYTESIFAGQLSVIGSTDGPLLSATFLSPQALW